VNNQLKILQVNTYDISGGAARVALSLHEAYRKRGHDSWLAVGRKRSTDPDIFTIPQSPGTLGWSSTWWRLNDRLRAQHHRFRGIGKAAKVAGRLARPSKIVQAYRGIEDFEFPGTDRLDELPPRPPDVIHCHNLHGNFFDLRALPRLSSRRPLIVTLHDAWLLSGHWSHSFDCERWRIGCGHCPDLTIYPSVRRDATDLNWVRKREIYEKSRLYLATPSRWLMRNVHDSILAPGIVDSRVIPNGIDTSVFKPGDTKEARMELKIPLAAKVLVSCASHIATDPLKRYSLMRDAVRVAASQLPEEHIVFIAVGEDGPNEKIGNAEFRFVPFHPNPSVIARHYHTADIYIHAAKAENHCLTILEALSTGVPVVATGTTGVVEQVRSLNLRGISHGDIVYPPAEATGVLTPPDEHRPMGDAIVHLLEDPDTLTQLSRNARTEAVESFDFSRQIDAYLSWYTELAGLAGRLTAAAPGQD